MITLLALLNPPAMVQEAPRPRGTIKAFGRHFVVAWKADECEFVEIRNEDGDVVATGLPVTGWLRLPPGKYQVLGWQLYYKSWVYTWTEVRW